MLKTELRMFLFYFLWLLFFFYYPVTFISKTNILEGKRNTVLIYKVFDIHKILNQINLIGLVLWSFSTQSMVLGSVASTSPGSLLQNAESLGPPQTYYIKFYISTIPPRWCICIVKTWSLRSPTTMGNLTYNVWKK